MMLLGSWPSTKRLAIAAIALIIIFASVLNLQYRTIEKPSWLPIPSYGDSNTPKKPAEKPTEAPNFPPLGNATLLKSLGPSYVQAILNPQDDHFDRLQCPKPNEKRYAYLSDARSNTKVDAPEHVKYFFALNLRQCIAILPRLLASIVETVRFLGPENCALSIVEGNSDDGTLEILAELRAKMHALGLTYYLAHSEINPKVGDRIEGLAALRNEALKPLLDNPKQYSTDTALIFINDVAICMEDILELVHQRVFQKADMTCAMDWNDIDPAPIFYDIWIARAINGDTFWQIPENGGWHLSSNLFWNHALSRKRYDEHKAFQVFACWNGAVVFSAKPLIESKIKFRKPIQGECFQGEPRLFAKDLWMAGYSKIAVVPSVNLDYSDKSAKKAKKLHGYVSDAVKDEDGNDASLQITWEAKPPEKVKCMADFNDQSWVVWNQGFENKNQSETP